MKTNILNTVCSLCIAALVLTSCKSKDETDVDATTGTEITSETNLSTDNDATAADAETTANQNQSTTSGNSSSGKTTNNSKASAADGTNKENHDGDMYTKNDTTPMPSGTSIK